MAFELESPTKVKVVEVFVLSQKNRQPDEDPGAKLSVSALLSNDVLAGFDGALKSSLFTRNAQAEAAKKQGSLDGMEVSDMPDLTGIGKHVKTLPWVDELTGYHLVICQGIGGLSDIEIDDCKLSNFRIQPQPGGTVMLKFDMESPNVSEKTWGKLAKLKSCEVDIVLVGPDVDQLSIEGERKSAPAAKASNAAPDATAAFVAAHGGSAVQ